MRCLLLLAALGGPLVPGAASSQDRSARSDLKDGARDAGYVLSAPLHATSADWRTAGLVGAGFGALLLVDEPIQDWIEDSFLPRLLSPFGESSPMNLLGRTWQVLLPLSAALYLGGLAADSDGLRDAGIGCATSNLTTTATRAFTSVLVGRLRPGVSRSAFVFQPFGGWDMRSFPGGHAANVMSCASYFSHRFELGLAEPALYGAAGAVSLARVADQAHWTSDSFAGMAYGYSVGRAVALRQRDRAQRRGQSFQPTLYVGWRITF